MICPAIHPEPCPDPEACQTGYPCHTVLSVHEARMDGDVTVIEHMELRAVSLDLWPLPEMEGQITIIEKE